MPFSCLPRWEHRSPDSSTLPGAPCFVNTENPFVLKVDEEHNKYVYVNTRNPLLSHLLSSFKFFCLMMKPDVEEGICVCSGVKGGADAGRGSDRPDLLLVHNIQTGLKQQIPIVPEFIPT